MKPLEKVLRAEAARLGLTVVRVEQNHRHPRFVFLVDGEERFVTFSGTASESGSYARTARGNLRRAAK